MTNIHTENNDIILDTTDYIDAHPSPDHMPDIPEDPPYRDLTEFELFRDVKVLK